MAETINNNGSNLIAQTGDAVNAADAKRTGELAEAKALEVIKYNALVKESARLAAKYGKDDPRVQVMNTQLGYSPSIQAAFDREAVRLSVPAAAGAADGWLVQGLVTGADGKAVGGVTVFLTTDGKTALAGLPYSCTAATGAYRIQLTSDQLAAAKKDNPVLAVSDANKKLLYTDSQKLGDSIVSGTIYSRNLVIGGAGCGAPPEAGGAPVK